MRFFKKCNIILIPSYLKVFVYINYSLLILKFYKFIAFINLFKKLIIINFKNSFLCISLKNKFLKSFFKKFKMLIFELNYKIYKKLLVIGIGFKIFKIKKNSLEILIFKIGLSHYIYLKISKYIKFYIFEKFKLYLLSCSILDALYLTYLIRNLKLPNFFNNKGIFYYNSFFKKYKK